MSDTETLTQPSMVIEAQLGGAMLQVQIVRYIIPSPSSAVLRNDDSYIINMCLTPRPLNVRACYTERWGPHRFERVGDIFLVPPGESVLIRGEGGHQSTLLAELKAEAVDCLIGASLRWTDQQLATTLDLTSARIRALLFRLTEEVHHPGFASDALLDLLGGELAIELARFCQEVSERPITGGLAGWRMRLIDERLNDSPNAPTLEALASLCNISVRQLTRGFRVSRGCSIGDYIERHRMETAKRLLMAGESVKAIAFAMGFASPSSFTFAFRRAVGISPSNFRQRQLRAIRPNGLANDPAPASPGGNG
jgi:AraC family transcriptional regulator